MRRSVEKRNIKTHFANEVKWLSIEIALSISQVAMIFYIFTFYEINVVSYMLLGITILFCVNTINHATQVVDLFRKI